MNNPNDPPPRFALDLTLAPSRAEGRARPRVSTRRTRRRKTEASAGGASSSSAAAAPRRRRASFGGTGPDDPDDRFSADWRRPGTVLALRPRGATSAVPVLALVAGSSAVAERREAGEPRGPCRLWTAKPLVDAGGRRHYYSAEILDGVVAHQRAYGSAHAAPKVPFLQALIGAKSATHVRFDDPEDGSSEDGGSEGTARDHVEGSRPAAAAVSSSAASTASNVDRHAIDRGVFGEDAARRPSPPDASRVGATSRKGRQDRRVSKKGGGGGGSLGVIRADSDGGLSRYLLMRREAAKAGGVKALEKLAEAQRGAVTRRGRSWAPPRKVSPPPTRRGTTRTRWTRVRAAGSLDRAGFTSARTAGTTRRTPLGSGRELFLGRGGGGGGGGEGRRRGRPPGRRRRRRGEGVSRKGRRETARPSSFPRGGSAARPGPARVREDPVRRRVTRRPRARRRRVRGGRGAVGGGGAAPGGGPRTRRREETQAESRRGFVPRDRASSSRRFDGRWCARLRTRR